MSETWIVCAGEGQRMLTEQLVVPAQERSEAQFISDVWQLRAAVAALGRPSVAVGPGLAMDPLNVGAALAQDGQARRVAVVAPGLTREQRFWARAAGIGDVYDLAETAPGVRQAPAKVEEEDTHWAEGPLKGVQEPSYIDLDEPEGVDEPESQGSKSLGLACAGTQTQPVQEALEPSRAPLLPELGEAGLAGAPVIALASARGGVGKSSIAALMGVHGARWGLRVALLDFDLAFGDLYGFFGHPAPIDLMDVVRLGATSKAGQLSLAGSGAPVAEGLTLYGPCAAPEYAELVAPHALELVLAAKRTFDLVIVDTSQVWGDAQAQALQAADRVAIVGDERAGAIGSLARAAKLVVRLGVARTRIVRLMNRCDPRCRDEEFMTRASLGLETTSSFRVFEGTLDVAELLSAGHAAELADLDNEFSSSCASVLAKLLAELGQLPDHPEAQKAREAKLGRRRSMFSFAKVAG